VAVGVYSKSAAVAGEEDLPSHVSDQFSNTVRLPMATVHVERTALDDLAASDAP
jgi:hypothetical protein